VSTASREVIAWAHGTTGVAQQCAPSLLLPSPWGSASELIGQVPKQGWVLVATDYTGMGTKGPTPYLIGQGEGRSVLDAVRAAKHLPGLKLAPRTVVWGHSQGGNAALWAGFLAPSYAPDADVVGVAALAPVSHLLGVIDPLKTAPGGILFESYMITAYSQNYPDVHFNHYVVPAARAIARSEASRCLDQKAIRESELAPNATKNIFIPNATSGAFGKRLSENSPTRHVQAPLLVAQGGADTLILPKLQSRFVKQLCDSGQSLEYRTYAGQDHNSVIANESPLSADLIRWTRERFAGNAQPSGCHALAR